MNTFCPLIKETCKKEECLAWKDQACLVFLFLGIQVENNKLINLNDFNNDEEDVQKIPIGIQSATPEELAQNLIEFAKTEFVTDKNEQVWINSALTNYFWKSKNIINRWGLPVEIEMKIEKAEKIAIQLLQKESKEQSEKQIEQESADLPKLIEDCVKWAQQKGLKKVTHADIDAYLMNKKLDIHYETNRNLYSNVNLELKTAPK